MRENPEMRAGQASGLKPPSRSAEGETEALGGKGLGTPQCNLVVPTPSRGGEGSAFPLTLTIPKLRAQVTQGQDGSWSPGL